MRLGNLDRRIAVERATAAVNSLGEPQQAWVLLAEVWAAVTPVQDGERWRAHEVAAHVTHRFVIRYSAGVATVGPKDRILFDGSVFDISGVKEIGRRDGLEITACARGE